MSKNEQSNVAQQKYNDCMEILENIHNALALVLTLSTEFDDKEPIDIIQNAIDQFREFESMTPDQKLKLEIESESLIEQIKVMNPNIDIVDSKPKTKKELLN